MHSHFGLLLPNLLLLVGLALPTSLEARSKSAQESGATNLAFIADLAPSKMGTDRQGNLWTWNRKSATIEVFSPQGARLSRFKIPGVRSLDVDAEWGVVATRGSAVELIGDSGAARTISLENQAAHVAWIDGNTVALSTTQAATKIEIWDVSRGVRLRSFGLADEIAPQVGAVLLRSLILRYSASTDTLFALDSVNGVLESWTLNGKLVRTESFPSPLKAEIEEWLAKADLQAKAANDIFTPFYEVLRLAVDLDGSAWVVKDCSPGRDRAALLRVSGGSSETLELDLSSPCCSNLFTIWNDHFISARTARPDSPDCAVWKELP